jgi:hypothetical protein
MNLNGSGPVTGWHAFLAEGNEKKKRKDSVHSNQDSFKRLVGTGSRKWSKLSDEERSCFKSLATGKEERMAQTRSQEKKLA